MLPKVDFKEHVCKCAMIFFFLLSAIDFCNITYSEEIRSRGRCICFLLVLTTLKSYQQGRNFCVPPSGKSADALICYLLFALWKFFFYKSWLSNYYMSSPVNQSAFQFLFPYNTSPLLPEYAESQKVNYVLFPKMHRAHFLSHYLTTVFCIIILSSI